MSALTAIGPAFDADAAGFGSAEAVTLDGRALRVAFGPVDEPAWDPQAPDCRDAVLVAGDAFSCNYRDGALAQAVLHPTAAERFLVLGSEVAGRVLAVGPDVRGLSPGQPVMGCPAFGQGAPDPWGVATNHASRPVQVLPATKLVPLPAGMEPTEAAAFALGAMTAAAMVRKAAPAAGERVLVTSASSNTGLFALGLLAATGAAVSGWSRSPQRAAVAAELTGVEVASGEAPGGGPFDAVLAPLGDVVLPDVARRIRDGGRIVTCGLRRPSARGTGTPLAPVLAALIEGNVTLVANCLGTPADLDTALAAWRSGALRTPIDRVIDARPGQAAAFFERTFSDPARVGKVVALHG
jgi:NADPH:quinone reductase-like Zn-dependent oxidoreductase